MADGISTIFVMEYTVNKTHARACSDCASDSICQPKWNYVTCVCKAGFTGNGFQCMETSACTATGCCPSGYTWDEETCVDVDECTDLSLNKCSPPSTCVNEMGTYVCTEDRSVPCNVSPCDSSMDCLNVNGELQCTDPCLNYQELDGTARLSNVSSTGRFLSDRSLYGWFRYMGSAGVRMKEGCVGGLRCGSAEPFTLVGSHPALEAGIRTIPVQINTISGACTRYGSILVKACPGDFYVYKFSGSSRSEVFCTDWKS
ncbi:uromodulin-like [Pleurodeles waltl]|uniref:uromodulin-like n=1 Tax=Pleurodeles waltl TaxID=8319 RepID=UPI003709AB56